MKVLVIYYSRSGNTKEVAELIAQFIKGQEIEVDIAEVESFEVKKLLDYDGIIAGSPTYYGTLAAPLKKLFDDSVVFHGKLDGKIGAAFSTSANLAGGNETTVLSILEAMLIHGMVIQGDHKGDHYGPVAVGKIDSRTQDNCQRLAQRFVKLLKAVR